MGFLDRRSSSLLVVACAVSIGVSCGSDSTSPTPPPAGTYQLIQVGDTVESAVNGSDSSWYVFHSPIDGQAQVYVQATGTNFQYGASVADSGPGYSNSFGDNSNHPTTPLLGNGSPPVPVHAGEAIAIKIRNQSSAHIALRLLAAAYSLAPEHSPDTLVVDQVNESETIPVSADADLFRYHGVAGHSYTIAVQPIQAIAPGFFGLTWRDSAGAYLGSAASGDPDSTLDQTASDPVVAQYDGTYTIRVDYFYEFAPGAALRPGGYRLEVRDVSAAIHANTSPRSHRRGASTP